MSRDPEVVALSLHSQDFVMNGHIARTGRLGSRLMHSAGGVLFPLRSSAAYFVVAFSGIHPMYKLHTAEPQCGSLASHRQFMEVAGLLPLVRYFAILTGLALSMLPGMARTADSIASPSWVRPQIHVEDVSRFYSVYDEAGGRPTADKLQRDYIDVGSAGLRTFARLRAITGATIAAELSSKPEIYADAKRCAAVLPRVHLRIEAVMRRLATLYPGARFPPVTVSVGRGKPVAIGSSTDGVMVGLEALCSVKYFDRDIEDRFVHVIAHEYIHVQQPDTVSAGDDQTVLAASLMEGGAEFLGYLISGGVANPFVLASLQGREEEVETNFVADEDLTDLSPWLYNGTLETPGDLGYWVGFRIIKAYYDRASDKRRAIMDIIQLSDPKAILADSGWHPGNTLR